MRKVSDSTPAGVQEKKKSKDLEEYEGNKRKE